MLFGELKNNYKSIILITMKNNLFLSMLYIEMAYTRKPATRKIYRKKTGVKKVAKRTSTTSQKSLVALIKKVSLKQCETKTCHSIAENLQLYHNVPHIRFSLLRTSQGITDADTGTNSYSNRIGDEIVARGIAIKLWIANKLDRPNIMYRLVVCKYESSITPTSSLIFKGANPNKMMDNLNKEKITIVYQKIFSLQTGMSAAGDAAGNPFVGKECHTYRKIWIPLNNKKVLYDDGGQVPKFTDYLFTITPYDSYGTLTTDNVASYAFEYNLYFKDP